MFHIGKSSVHVSALEGAMDTQKKILLACQDHPYSMETLLSPLVLTSINSIIMKL